MDTSLSWPTWRGHSAEVPGSFCEARAKGVVRCCLRVVGYAVEEPGKVLERDIYIPTHNLSNSHITRGFFDKHCIRVWLSEEGQGFSCKSDAFSE